MDRRRMENGLQEVIERLGKQLDLSKVVQYLKDREKEEGGFSFVPELYPDIEDTYYAIRIFQILNVNVDRNKTANYLKNIDWKGTGFPRAVYMLLYIHLSVGMELPDQLYKAS
jgi:hypothetical protein